MNPPPRSVFFVRLLGTYLSHVLSDFFIYLSFGLPFFLFLMTPFLASFALRMPLPFFHLAIPSQSALDFLPRLLVPSIYLTSSFLTLFTHVCSNESLSIFISATSILPSWVFVIGTVFILYGMSGLTHVR